MIYDEGTPYTGPTSFHVTSGIQLYSTGYVGDEAARSADDGLLRKAVEGAGLVPRTIRLRSGASSEDRSDFILFLQVGDGSVGSDESENVGSLHTIAGRADDTIALARDLRRILGCAQRSGYKEWRVAAEGTVVACLANLYEHTKPTGTIFVRDVRVTSLSREASYSVPIPRAGYIVSVPELDTVTTHILTADSDLNVQYMGRLAGLSDGANFERTTTRASGAWKKGEYRYPEPRAEDAATTRERILREIFFPEAWSGGPLNDIAFSPSHEALGKFADLLGVTPFEEDLQRFLTEWPGFLMGLCGYADSSELAFLTKPRIGPNYVADFAIVGANQGGAGLHLIEIEPSSSSLFTQKLTPAQRYQSAIGQVTEWGEWIARNERTFVSDVIRLAMSLPMWPNRSENGSFRRRDPYSLEQTFSGFGGFDMPSIDYNVIIGRWSELSPEERDRLIYLNTKSHKFATYTYDQVARQAFQRPITHW